uniref:LOW QUALITY PROTEIN: ATPase family protein 2 homolog n=1 Tax=Styela clava TaxID=7725 RepID=UPI00193A0FE1|nr:LOW QUALITY PROTEIN: ATPase family protein 2 homolog [Styela clava]
MSSKKSKFKPQWIYSEELGGYQLFQKNREDTPINGKDQSVDCTPFISDNGLLSAQVVFMERKDIKVSHNVKNSIVELHPDTMQLCEMRLGGPVVISTAPNQHGSKMAAMRVWPNINIPLGKVALTEYFCHYLHINEGETIDIIETESMCVQASTVTANIVNAGELEQKFLNSANFKEYLQHVLDKRYFLIGQQLSIDYFGKFMQLEIRGADGQTAENRSISLQKTELSDISDLSVLNDSFADISLHSSGNNTQETFMKKGFGVHKLDFSYSSTPKEKKTLPLTKDLSETSEGCRKTTNVSSSVFLFTQKTKLQFDTEYSTSNKNNVINNDENFQYFGNVSYSSIGGLEHQIKVLKDMVELPMTKSHLFKMSGLSPPSGILLHGPPGTGKSMLVKACVNETNVKTFLLQGAKILSRYFGDSEQKLHDLFKKARDEAPSVIVIDEIDAICPQRETSKTDVEKRLVSSFITLLDGVTSSNQSSSKYVILLATTNRIDALDPSLRRAGRFDCEIEIPIPSPSGRIEIFQRLMSTINHTLKSKDIELLAEKAHGYVGADISAVCKEAGMKALQRTLNDTESSSEVIVNNEDFQFGLKQVPPSAMRELIVQVPKVLWSDIGGNSEVKKKLKQAIEWPLKNPAAFQRLGIEPPRGVLLYGPPGCSKTLTAKALATESGLNFISIKGPELFSKYVGDSEKAIREFFSKARSAAPSIVFFDELDALAIERGGSSSKGGGSVADRVLAAMLTEMDGVEQRRDVIVVAATNRPDMIDKVSDVTKNHS